MGTIGAGAAYLTGRRAAAALQDLSPATESAIADHENLAVLTLITLSIVSLVRLMVSWLARYDRRINLGIFRLVAIPVTLAGLVMLALTADRGGNLVYRHGVGVTAQHDVGEVD
jgi:uncharacterized membrane protein